MRRATRSQHPRQHPRQRQRQRQCWRRQQESGAGASCEHQGSPPPWQRYRSGVLVYSWLHTAGWDARCDSTGHTNEAYSWFSTVTLDDGGVDASNGPASSSIIMKIYFLSRPAAARNSRHNAACCLPVGFRAVGMLRNRCLCTNSGGDVQVCRGSLVEHLCVRWTAWNLLSDERIQGARIQQVRGRRPVRWGYNAAAA